MKQLLGFLLIISTLAFVACKSTQESKAEPVPPTTAQTGKSTRLVKVSELETFLPTEVFTIKRSEMGGERTELADKNVVLAAAEYKGTDKMLRITITDASTAAAGVSGLAPWVKGDINNKWEQGYERTADIEGYKGYESYDRADQTGQASVLVNNRFVVSVAGEKVAEGEPREALKILDLNKLANLR